MTIHLKTIIFAVVLLFLSFSFAHANSDVDISNIEKTITDGDDETDFDTESTDKDLAKLDPDSEVVGWVVEPTNNTAPVPTVNPYILAENHNVKDVKELFENGVKLVKAADYKNATMLFLALRQSPKMKNWNFRSHLLLAYSYIQLGQDREAVEHLAKTPAAFGTISQDLRWMLAETYWRLEEYVLARANYRKIIRKIEKKTGLDRIIWEEWPYYQKSQLKEIQCLLAESKYRKAVKLISALSKKLQAQKDKQNKNKALANIGKLLWFKSLAYKGLGNHQKEIATLQWISLKYCGNIYYDEAKKRIQELIKAGFTLPHQDMETLLGSAETLRKLWQLNDTYELVIYIEKQLEEKKITADEQQLKRLAYVKGRTLIALRRPEEALPVFTSLVNDKSTLEKQDAYLYQLAKTHSKLNQTAIASAYYKEVSELYPDSGLANTAEFLSAWHLGFDETKWRTADKSLGEIQEKNKRKSLAQKALWFRGWFAYKHKDYNLALARFGELLETFPRSQFADACRYWSGRIHHIKANLPTARSYYLYFIGLDDTSYYKLLATNRLNELDLLDMAISDSKSTTGGLAGKTGDLKVDKVIAERQEDWKELKKQIALNKEFSIDEFREGMKEAQTNFISESSIGRSARERRIDKLSLELKSVFPDSRRFVVFYKLGMYKEASETLGRLGELLYRTPKRLLSYHKRKYEKEDLSLLEHRITSKKKLYKKYYLDMFWNFVEMSDFSRAFRVYIKGLNSRTRNYLPDDIRKAIRYPLAYRDKNQLYAEEQQITDDLVFSIMRTESYFKHWVVSRVNAVGLMQIMPQTGYLIAERIGDEDFSRQMLFNTETNIGYGAWYLKQLMTKFDNQLPLAIAAYNGGPFNVELWLDKNKNLEWDEFIESIEFSQTRGYVKKVLRTMAAYRMTYTGSSKPWDFTRQINYNYGDNINF